MNMEKGKGNNTMDDLITLIENLAKEETDGHVTLMKFTGGWKVFLGTPLIDYNEGRDKLGAEIQYSTLKEGIISLLDNPHSI
jgi:hypothetical protein